jgi:bacterioferritin
MKGNKVIIDHLNQVLRNELTAINQYFLHSKMFKDWGYKKLGDYEYSESIDEMKHADQIITRILFLEGLPNVQDMNKVMIGEEPVECLNCDLVLEEKALVDLKNAIVDSEKLRDFVSRDLFRSILDSEEEHVDVIETHLGLVNKVGKENWLQSQI